MNDLTENQSYKCLGFHQLRGIKHTEIQEKLTAMLGKRLRIICKSYLNTANKTKSYKNVCHTYFNLFIWHRIMEQYGLGILRTTSPKNIDKPLYVSP
jgi:D-hexose-6-phosphate mutarotase